MNSFSLHLLELRYRAYYFFFSLCITFLAATLSRNPLTHLICTPFSSGTENCSTFIFTHVTEGLYAALECSFMCTLFFCIPFLIYQVYSFFMPSCYQGERMGVNLILFFIALLFFMSLYTAYIIVLPKMCTFLQQFQHESKSMEIKLEARIAPAVRWSCTAAFFTAAFFQMPAFFFLLLNWGFVKHSFLCKNRKYAFFSILLIASLLSPPDVSTQIIFATMVYLLYEFFIWCALFYHKWYELPTPHVALGSVSVMESRSAV